MDHSNALLVLKYAGTATAALYAGYQLVADYRERHGSVPSHPGRRAKRLKIALAFVAIGALMSLLGDIGSEYRNARDKLATDSLAAIDRDQRIQEAAMIVRSLREQLGEVRAVQATLTDQQEELKRQSGALNAQRQVQERLSREMTTTAGRAAENIELSSSVLKETVDRADVIEVEIQFSVNPASLRKRGSTEPLLPRFMLDAMETHLDTAEVAVGEREKVIYMMRSQPGEVFRQLLKNWEVWVAFNRNGSADQHDMFFSRRNSDGVQGVSVVGIDPEPFRGYALRGVLCSVRYSFVPNRAEGYRMFSDFSNKYWQTWVQMDPALAQLRSVSLYLGAGATRSRLTVTDFRGTMGYSKWAYQSSAQLP
jgi:hypothetical protein